MSKQASCKKILIIDDDPSVLKLVQTLLIANHYEVTPANDAPQGLELAMKTHPDLIVLDVMMPIINGFNICRLLKSQEGHQQIPVVLLTSRAEESDRMIGEEVGADAYLAKPINTKEFLETVAELLA